MKMKKKGYAMGGMKKKGYAMGGMKKKMKAGGGIKKMTAGGPTAEGTKMRRIGAGMEDRDAVTKKFSERGTSGAAEARKQKGAMRDKTLSDLDNVERYGKDAPKGRSFGQKTQPAQGKMKGKVPLLRKTAPGSDTLTTKDMPMNKKGGSIKKMKAGGGVAKKGKAKGGKAKGGKSKVRGAGIAQRGVRPAKMR